MERVTLLYISFRVRAAGIYIYTHTYISVTKWYPACQDRSGPAVVSTCHLIKHAQIK